MHTVIKACRWFLSTSKSPCHHMLYHHTDPRYPSVTTVSSSQIRASCWNWCGSGGQTWPCSGSVWSHIRSIKAIISHTVMTRDPSRKSLCHALSCPTMCGLSIYLYLKIIKQPAKHLSAPCIIWQMKMFVFSWALFQYVWHVISFAAKTAGYDLWRMLDKCSYMFPRVALVPLETPIMVSMRFYQRKINK